MQTSVSPPHNETCARCAAAIYPASGDTHKTTARGLRDGPRLRPCTPLHHARALCIASVPGCGLGGANPRQRQVTTGPKPSGNKRRRTDTHTHHHFTSISIAVIVASVSHHAARQGLAARHAASPSCGCPSSLVKALQAARLGPCSCRGAVGGDAPPHGSLPDIRVRAPSRMLLT